MELDLELHISGDDIAWEELFNIVTQLLDINSLDITVRQLAHNTDLIDVTFSASESNNMNGDSLFFSVLTNLSVVFLRVKLTLWLAISANDHLGPESSQTCETNWTYKAWWKVSPACCIHFLNLGLKTIIGLADWLRKHVGSTCCWILKQKLIITAFICGN